MLTRLRTFCSSLANRLIGASSRCNRRPDTPPGLDPLGLPCKAAAGDFPARFREIVSDPLNLLIARDPRAGVVEGGHVYLHNGNLVAHSGPMSYYAGFSDVLVINRGVHEPAEEFAFQQLLEVLQPAPVMLELGAYWCHYSMWLKKARPRATLYMVEPDASNLAVGRHNFALNGYDGEFIHAKVGEGHFEIDRFLASKGLHKLDVLHSDIQGFEMEMLDGADAALRQKQIDYVFVSTHSNELHRDVRARLEGRGYVIEVAADFETETTSHDGLVFARSPEAVAVACPKWIAGRRDLAGYTPAQLVHYLRSFHTD